MQYVSKSKRDIYLVCASARGGKGCAYKSYRYIETESFLLKLLSCIDYSKLDGDNYSELQATLSKVDLDIIDTQSKLSNLIKLIEGGSMSEIIINQVDQREVELKALKDKQNITIAELDSSKANNATKAFNSLKSETFNDRLKLNLFLKQYIDKIVFDGENALLHFSNKLFVAEAKLFTDITTESLAALYDNEIVAGFPVVFNINEEVKVW